MDSIQQTAPAVKGAHPPAGVAGAATCRPSGPATPGVPGTQDQAEGRKLPPPLELPPGLAPPQDPRINPKWSAELQASVRALYERVASTRAQLEAIPGHSPPPADLGAMGEPVPAGEAPEGPSTIVHEGHINRKGLPQFSPPGQLVLTVGSEPLVPPAQRGFDAAWYSPPPPTLSDGANVNVGGTSEEPVPEPPPDAGPGPADQACLPLPRPWLDLDGPLFDLLHGAEFAIPHYGDAPKPKRGEFYSTPGAWLHDFGESWKHILRCCEHYAAPAGLLANARKKVEKVPDCGKRWGNVWQCDTCKTFDRRHAINLTKCRSRMCPFCGKVRRGRWVSPLFAYTERYRVKPRTADSKGHLSRDWYMDTITDVKLPTISVRGLRASTTAIKKKWDPVARLARHLPRDKDWPGEAEWQAAKARFAAEMAAAKELPAAERKAEQARIRAEQSALWKRHHHKWPGDCDDFGELFTIDMDTEAFVHAHGIRYGAWVWADDMRAVCGGTWTYIEQVRPKYRKGRMETPEEAQAHAIFECVKYPVKVTTKPGSNYYVHPYLAALFEFATCGMRLTEGYGTMRGLVSEDDSDEGGAEEEEKPEEPTVCPKCGGTKLTATVLTFALGTWARSRPAKPCRCPIERKPEIFKGRAPPGGGAT